MKRIIPALAAVVLGSGCVVTADPCDGTLTVDWQQFRDANNAVWSYCYSAGVSTVDVYVDGAAPYSVPCTDYSMVIPAAEGTHSVVVEGLDAGGYILYRDSFPSASVACNMDTPVNSTPSEGYFDIAYTVTSGTCSSYSPSYVWFSIHDWTTQNTTWNSVGSGSSDPAYYGMCSYYGDLLLRLPAGSYTLDGVQEMGWSSGYYLARSDCTYRDFDVSGGYTTTRYPMLSTLGAYCF